MIPDHEAAGITATAALLLGCVLLFASDTGVSLTTAAGILLGGVGIGGSATAFYLRPDNSGNPE